MSYPCEGFEASGRNGNNINAPARARHRLRIVRGRARRPVGTLAVGKLQSMIDLSIFVLQSIQFRNRFLILVVAICVSTGCHTEIGSGGIGGNISALDPDIVYFPPPNQAPNQVRTDAERDADKATKNYNAEPVASNLDRSESTR